MFDPKNAKLNHAQQLKFYLSCLIIALPFYAYTNDSNPTFTQQTTAKQQPDLVWNFTIQRTTPAISQEWLHLLADYIYAAKVLFTPDILKEIKNTCLQMLSIEQGRYLSYCFDSRITDTRDNEIKELQPFLGKRLATFLEQQEHTNGIHGKLDVGIYELNEADTLEWKLEIYLDKDYSPDAFNKLKDDLIALTNELSNGTLEQNNLNYGNLLHGVVEKTRTSNAYSCTTSLTIPS